MNAIRNYNDKNIGCILLKLQLGSIHSKADVYEADVISASLSALFFLMAASFHVMIDLNCIIGKRDRNDNEDNLNFTNIYPCFGFADIAHNVDMHISKNSIFQRIIEAVVRDPHPLLCEPL